MLKKAIIFYFSYYLILSLVGLPTIYAQKVKNREDLENKKKENIKQIAEIKNILSKTIDKKEANLGQLKAINKEVEIKEKQITLINQDLTGISNEIYNLQVANNELSKNYNNLKKEYSQMVYSRSKTMNNFTSLSFLFSSASFNQLFMRYNYLQQIATKRQKQAIQIDSVIKELRQKQKALSTEKKHQNTILNEKVAESNSLEQSRLQKQKITEKLVQKEGDLKKQLIERKRAVMQLENMISAMIEKEIKRTRNAERKAAAENSENKNSKKENVEIIEKNEKSIATNTIKMTPNEANLSSSFASNKAKLPWPVRSGFISEAFGSHPHEVLKGITVPNDGIEIQTSAGENVRAVFDGIVMIVDNSILGMGSVVAIQHGDYFTIYGKLRNVIVSPGQHVKTKDTIGTVMEGKDGTSEVQFQVWKNTARQNPERWLLNR